MGRYVIRRLLQMIPVFFGVTFIMYFLMFALGDPIKNLGAGKQKNPAYEAFLTEQFNLDDPFIVQYLKYLGGIFTGDFGSTFVGQARVGDLRRAVAGHPEAGPDRLRHRDRAGHRASASSRPGARAASSTRRRWPAPWSSSRSRCSCSASSCSTSSASSSGWFPPAGIADGWPTSYILPAFVLAPLSLAFVLRLTRYKLLETFGADFMRTAKAKGLPDRTIMRKYGLRNSLIPVVTFLGADLGALLGGAVITEGIFNLPGIGQQLYASIRLQETAVVVGFVTIIVIVFLLMSLLVDVLYAFLDPRIRYE